MPGAPLSAEPGETRYGERDYRPTVSRVLAADTLNVRFPTSMFLDGSDAMNPDPDYSSGYLRIRTDADDGLEGHGFVFTIGRGNDAQVAAIRTVVDTHLLGRLVEPLLDDMGGTWRELVHDSQLRWLGPEKGAMHMAIGAVVNALWDLRPNGPGCRSGSCWPGSVPTSSSTSSTSAT